jgi:hypothetical protein
VELVEEKKSPNKEPEDTITELSKMILKEKMFNKKTKLPSKKNPKNKLSL